MFFYQLHVVVGCLAVEHSSILGHPAFLPFKQFC